MRSCSTIIALVFATLLGFSHLAGAHEGWIQSNVSRTIKGEMVYIDMQFGNHGNTHRDYKIWASKWDKEKSVFLLHSPSGEIINMADSVIDIGHDETKTICDGTATYIDKNGYLVTSFQTEQRGIYIMDVRQDMVVNYAPERSIKCTKSIVGVVPSIMGKSRISLDGYDQTLGQVIEIIPLQDPTSMKVGDTFSVQVLFKGEPLADAHLSITPRGKTLPPFGVENPNDVMTDMEGIASYTFTEANYHLLAVQIMTDEGGTLHGKEYTHTKYSAALTVIVSPE